MAVHVTGLRQVQRKLGLKKRRVNSESVQEMLEGARELADLAARMAPHDTGALESAIFVDEPETKMFVTTVTVGIDASVVRTKPGYPTETVGDYAEMVHELKNTVGRSGPNYPYDLGPRTAEKNQRMAETVGGKFMTRAADELRPGIFERIKKAVYRAIR